MGFAGDCWDFDGEEDNGSIIDLGSGVIEADLEKPDCFGTLIFNTSGVLALVGTVASDGRPLAIDSS